MFNTPQWINWHIEDRPGNKPAKVPGLGYRIDPLKRENWMTYEQACALDPARVGFVLTAHDPYWCIDLDHCLVDGQWNAHAQTVLALFPGAYVEISFSGDGLHIFGQGIPLQGYNARVPGTEFYYKDRFIAVTGTEAQGTADLDFTQHLAGFQPAYLGSSKGGNDDGEWTNTPVPEHTPIEDDSEVIRRMLSGKQSAAVVSGTKASVDDMWHRRIEVLREFYPPEDPTKDFAYSEVDAAMASHILWWTGKDMERTERIMRMSNLVRKKWDERNAYYIKRTIRRASAKLTSVYTGGRGDLVTDALDQFLAYLPSHHYIYRPTRVLWPASSIDGSEKWIENAGGKKIKPSSWLDSHQSIQCMTWHPDYPEVIDGKVVTDGGWRDQYDARTYNQYLAPNVIPGDALAATPWREHLEHIYPGEADQHITAFLAHRVQRPGEKINHAIVLGGDQGIGKDTLLEPVKHGVGPWNFREIGPVQLLGRFNPHVKAVILRINEARDLGEMDRFSFYEHTKPLFASPPDVLLCDEKNTKEHYVFNVLGAIITTNYLTSGLFIPPDDRRHFVAWSNVTRDAFDEDYWPRLWAWLNNGGIGHVVSYLTNFDLSGFDPKKPPPKTEAWHQIVSAGIAPEESELADLIVEIGTPTIVTLEMLRSEAARLNGLQSNVAIELSEQRKQKALVHRLERIGYALVPNPDAKDGRWSSNGRKVRVYGRKEVTMSELLEMAGKAALAEFPISPTAPHVPSSIT